MSRKIITIISFQVAITFEKWEKIIDIKEADLIHSEFEVNPLFRGFSKDDTKKIIFINQSSEGNIQKVLQANSEWIKNHKFNFSTMEESIWI